MVFLYVAVVVMVVWCLAAVLLVEGRGDMGRVVGWMAGALACAAVATVVYGAYGMARDGDWLTLSIGQALHALLGEGSGVMRRSEWPALDRAAGAYLASNIGWTLLALCVIQFQSILFWSGIASRRRAARRR